MTIIELMILLLQTKVKLLNFLLRATIVSQKTYKKK